VETDVSEERIASIFREKIRERGTSVSRWLQATLKMEEIRSSEMSVPTRSTRRHIPENGIHQSHRRENVKSYIALNLFPEGPETDRLLHGHRANAELVNSFHMLTSKFVSNVGFQILNQNFTVMQPS
jgi:hypothetical protein